MVVLTAPELIPIIVSIPGKEFCPTSENFSPTVRQSFEAAGLAGPRMAGTLLAAAMPAHSQLFKRASAMDAAEMMRERNLGRWLGELKDGVNPGYPGGRQRSLIADAFDQPVLGLTDPVEHGRGPRLVGILLAAHDTDLHPPGVDHHPRRSGGEVEFPECRRTRNGVGHRA
jgi:hypothetical protein